MTKTILSPYDTVDPYDRIVVADMRKNGAITKHDPSRCGICTLKRLIKE